MAPDSPLALGAALVFTGGLSVIRAKTLAGRFKSRGTGKVLPVGTGLVFWAIRLVGVAAVLVGAALVLSSLFG
ncbi:MAG: hypothetical protein ACXWDQ_00155 [Solirubrobacterales bacterium]